MEDWDIVDSSNSSLSTNTSTTQPQPQQNNEKGLFRSLELDFNRFTNQPEFEIKDDDDVVEEYDEQALADQGVIFDSPPPAAAEEYEDDEELNFTLGDSKLMNNDTIVIDDVENKNNEQEQQRINQYKNNYLSSLFPPLNIMSEQDNNSTRESQVDKNATWKNSSAGSSVPYISDDIPKEQEQEPEAKPATFLPFGGNLVGGPMSFNLFGLPSQRLQEPTDHITQRLGQLQLDYEKNPDRDDTSLDDGKDNKEPSAASLRPIKQPRRRFETSKSPLTTTQPAKSELTMHNLPAFAATPRIPSLIIQQPSNTNIDIPPVEPPSLTIKRPTHTYIDIPPVEPPALTVEQLIHAYTDIPPATPKIISLTIQQLPNTNIDIPPEEQEEAEEAEEAEEEEEEEQPEQEPEVIKEKLSQCFDFTTDQDRHFARICFEIEKTIPDITQWYQLKTLNLSRQNITSLNNLKNCFPMLETLIISHNELKSIYGLPESLCYLHASNNKLCELDIYQLGKLQYLDVSNNFINSFGDMSLLKSLRTLDASYNMINSCKPFQNLVGLITLSLKSNSIRRLSGFTNRQQRNQLESLDVSFNRIECLDSVDSLRYLRELNVDHNDIKCIQLDQPMERLCKLKLSFNRLKSFDVSPFPDIRILYLDDNQIQRIIGVACVSRIDSFSLRDQGREKVEYNLQYLRGTRKLYLSGSPFKNMHQMIDFYSLEYLELCSAELESLPADFSKQVPNLCTLYLSMNRLQDIRPLKRLKYLKTLILIDNRLLSLNEVITVVKSLKKLHYLDLRQNPMCTNIYPSMNMSLEQNLNEHEKISHYITTAHDDTWEAKDLEFCQYLTDHWRTRREVYRALLIKECPKLLELDHLVVDSNDRASGDLVIENYYKARSPHPTV